MNRYIIAASIFAVSAGMAHAQNAAPATGATPPRPAVAAPATTAPTVPSPTVGKGSALTQADARQMYAASLTAKEAACKAKGATYIWTPAHSVGDANPRGGYYARNSAGSCRQMTLKAATEKGLVTLRN